MTEMAEPERRQEDCPLPIIDVASFCSPTDFHRQHTELSWKYNAGKVSPTNVLIADFLAFCSQKLTMSLNNVILKPSPIHICCTGYTFLACYYFLRGGQFFTEAVNNCVGHII